MSTSRTLRALAALPALLLPSFVVAQAGPVDARPIALEEAVRLAQQNAPALVQARGAMRSSSAQIRRSYAAFIPNVSFSAGTNRTEGAQYFQGQLVPLGSNPWSFSNTVSANVDLWDGGRRFHEMRRADAALDAAELGEVTQRYNVSLNVKQQYYAVLAGREQESAARQQLQQAEQQLAASIARVRAGAATKSDSLRSVIAVGNANLALRQAQNNINVANAALTRLVGAPYTVTASPADSLSPESVVLDSASLAELAERAPAVEQAEADLIVARMGVRTARSAYWPTVSTSYSYSMNQASPGFETGHLVLFGSSNPNRKQLNFNFQIPLFNQLNRETQIVTSEVAYRNAEAQARDARFAAQQQLAQSLGALRLAEERIAIQEASVAAAEEDLRVQTERYQLGGATLLDVLTSQATLNQARVALIQARYDARIAKAQLEALVGRDL